MIFGSGKAKHKEIGPLALADKLREGTAMVVDMREVGEFMEGHIPGAINLPLSTFDPSDLPNPEGKMLVLNCLGGKRSAMALDKCRVAQADVDTHLAGGFSAWEAAHLPVER